MARRSFYTAVATSTIRGVRYGIESPARPRKIRRVCIICGAFKRIEFMLQVGPKDHKCVSERACLRYARDLDAEIRSTTLFEVDE